MSERDEPKEVDIWKEHRYLEGQIKALGRPIDEIEELLREYRKSHRRLATQRSKQFANVVAQIQATKAGNRQAIGLIIRAFAEHVLDEARVIGITARANTEEIVDKIPDMDAEETMPEDEQEAQEELGE